MAINPDEDTEFNDALRKHGILPPKPEAPRTPSPPPPPSLEDELDDLTFNELKERAEDAHDSDEERFIASMQKRKLEQMVKDVRNARFGRIYPISREDYTREVTEASNENEDGSEDGTPVVCFLYKDGHVASERLFGFLRTLAPKYPQTKIVSIVGDKCIPNYPDRNLPTMILYRKGSVVDNLVAWGANEREPGTIHHLETVLLGLGMIDISKMAPDAREAARRQTEEEEDDEEEDQPRRTNIRPSSTRKKDKEDDSDSDFDL